MLALFAFVLATGCVSLPAESLSLGSQQAPIALTNVPFYPQVSYQCGPAALMTVLTYSGVETTLNELVEQVYLPGRQGSLQADLLGATRAAGRIPYRIDGSLEALTAELAHGRPVLVLQNLGVSWAPRWHYAVVAGIDPEARTLTLRSGTDRRRISKLTTFARTWQRSDFWAFITLVPGELPASPDLHRYLEAVAGMEATGHFREARAGWHAALEAWPDQPVALFGLGNTEMALAEFITAEASYRRLLKIQPDLLAARNNMALAMARQGKLADARREIRSVLNATDREAPLYAAFKTTLDEIEQLATTASE